MAKVLVTDTYLEDIADSIRAKNGSSDTYTPSQMSTAIDNIPSGGGTDLSEYFSPTSSTTGTDTISLVIRILKKIPSNTIFSNTNLQYAFSNCVSLIEIPPMSTSSVTNMSYMFYNCQTIKTIPNLDTSRVTNMGSMFNGCTNIETIPQLNTSKVTNMNGMFRNCVKLQEIPLSDTSLCTGFNGIFAGCSVLETIPQLNMSNATNIGNMCNNCTALKYVPVFNWGNVNGAYSMGSVFGNCLNLTDQSLNNILASCISATQYTGTKTLKQIGILNTTHYPVSRIQALSNYQDFINAGWSIGY